MTNRWTADGRNTTRKHHCGCRFLHSHIRHLRSSHSDSDHRHSRADKNSCSLHLTPRMSHCSGKVATHRRLQHYLHLCIKWPTAALQINQIRVLKTAMMGGRFVWHTKPRTEK